MLYIGERPTVSQEKKLVIEVNIFDFGQDIYGDHITVFFEEYVRSDQAFEGRQALADQLSRDKEAVTQLLAKDSYQASKTTCTIAILNYNGQNYLESYLPSILDSSDTIDFDILVIDNASTDGSVAYLKEWHPEVRIRELQQNYGFAGGYNKGLQGEQSEYLAIINSDVLVTQNWLDDLIAVLVADPSIGAIQPKIRSVEDKPYFEYAGAAGGYVDSLGYPFCRGRIFNTCEEDQQQYDDMVDVSWVSGACMVIRRKLYEGLGGFDAAYFAHHEEIDLCYRLRRAGYRLSCLPSSTVYHVGGGTLDYESPRKTLLNFRNNTATLIKNESKLKLLWLLPVRGGLDKVAALKFLLEGAGGSARAVIKALWQNYTSLPSIWSRRKHYNRLVQKHRIGPPVGPTYKGSVMWAYFIRGKKTYQQISDK
jgi:GT2 family glycosyltransferase